MSPKKQISDIVSPEKRSIRRIPLGNNTRNGNAAKPAPENTETPDTNPQSPPPPPRPPQPQMLRKKRSKKWHVIISVLVILLIVFVVMNMFGGATIAVTAQQESITIDGTFAADTEAALDVVPYELFTITREASREVEATGTETVETKASGTIIVFNDLGPTAQTLVENTRFRTPSGLIYRIEEQLIVPGQTTDENGETTPGSIEVRVVADESGEEYNIDLSDFDIPGFEESGDLDHFENFFARSKTPMTGGFDGTRKILNEADAETARETLDAQLTDELQTALTAELPEDFVVYDNTTFLSFRDIQEEDTTQGDIATLTRNGTLQAIVFDVGDLSSFVGFNTVAAYDGAEVALTNPQSLSFAMVNVDDFDPSAPGEFEFTLSGQDTLVWQFDEERLKDDLSGKHKQEIQTILSAYPAIQEADITLHPFWRRTFPQDVEDIKVKYE